MSSTAINKYKLPITYGVGLAILLFLLKWLEWNFVLKNPAIEIYGGAVAVLFMALGIWMATKMFKPSVQTVIVEKPVYQTTAFTINQNELNRLHISLRELEVLQLMAKGLSNQQIADQLFVSLNTIKTHSSNVFAKLDAGRRTQAIEKAKQLRLIP